MTKQVLRKRTTWLGLMCGALVLSVLGFQHMQAEAEEPRGPEMAGHDFPGAPPMFDDAQFPMLMMFLLQDQDEFAFKGEGGGPGEAGPEEGRRRGRGPKDRGHRDGESHKGGPEGKCGPECKEGCEKCRGDRKGHHGHHGRRGFGRRGHGPEGGHGPHGLFGMMGRGHGGMFGMIGPGHGGFFGKRGHGHHGRPDGEIRKMMMGNMGRLMALRSELDVTKEQREQLHGVMKNHRSSMHEKFGNVMKARKELQSQIMLGEATEDSIKASADQIAEAVTAVALEAKTARDEAMAVFSEDQQSKIQEVMVKNIATRKEIHEKMKAKMEEHKAKREAKKAEKGTEGKDKSEK